MKVDKRGRIVALGLYYVSMWLTPLFIALTVGMIGKVLLGIAVVRVHWRIVKEHRIDNAVLREIRLERNIAVVGILLILFGYFLELTHFGYVPDFFF